MDGGASKTQPCTKSNLAPLSGTPCTHFGPTNIHGVNLGSDRALTVSSRRSDFSQTTQARISFRETHTENSDGSTQIRGM